MIFLEKKYLILLMGVTFGSFAGFAYYHFIGCSSGTCPITSNWYISTIYGAFMGLLLTFPTKKKIRN